MLMTIVAHPGQYGAFRPSTSGDLTIAGSVAVGQRTLIGAVADLVDRDYQLHFVWFLVCEQQLIVTTIDS